MWHVNPLPPQLVSMIPQFNQQLSQKDVVKHLRRASQGKESWLAACLNGMQYASMILLVFNWTFWQARLLLGPSRLCSPLLFHFVRAIIQSSCPDSNRCCPFHISSPPSRSFHSVVQSVPSSNLDIYTLIQTHMATVSILLCKSYNIRFCLS